MTKTVPNYYLPSAPSPFAFRIFLVDIHRRLHLQTTTTTRCPPCLVERRNARERSAHCNRPDCRSAFWTDFMTTTMRWFRRRHRLLRRSSFSRQPPPSPPLNNNDWSSLNKEQCTTKILIIVYYRYHRQRRITNTSKEPKNTFNTPQCSSLSSPFASSGSHGKGSSSSTPIASTNCFALFSEKEKKNKTFITMKKTAGRGNGKKKRKKCSWGWRRKKNNFNFKNVF